MEESKISKRIPEFFRRKELVRHSVYSLRITEDPEDGKIFERERERERERLLGYHQAARTKAKCQHSSRSKFCLEAKARQPQDVAAQDSKASQLVALCESVLNLFQTVPRV